MNRYHEVKTAVLYYQQTHAVTDGSLVEKVAADIWTPQDNVTIIGIAVRAHIGLGSAPNCQEGECACWAEISKIAKMWDDGCLARAQVQVYDLVEAAYQGFVGKWDEESIVMFPPGFGVDVDKGDDIYANIMSFLSILSAGSSVNHVRAIIYYVER